MCCTFDMLGSAEGHSEKMQPPWYDTLKFKVVFQNSQLSILVEYLNQNYQVLNGIFDFQFGSGFCNIFRPHSFQ